MLDILAAVPGWALRLAASVDEDATLIAVTWLVLVACWLADHTNPTAGNAVRPRRRAQT